MERLTLTQIAKIIKSEWILLLLAFVAIGIFSLALFFRPRQPPPKTTPSQIPWQKTIFAGQTTTSQLTNTLGQPAKVENNQDKIIYDYSTPNQYRPNQVEIQGDTVYLIKEQVLESQRAKLNDYILYYGPPQAQIFGQHGTFAPGNFWGEKGLLVFAGNQEGIVIEIWYFQPTTLEDFLNNHPDFSEEQPRQF